MDKHGMTTYWLSEECQVRSMLAKSGSKVVVLDFTAEFLVGY